MKNYRIYDTAAELINELNATESATEAKSILHHLAECGRGCVLSLLKETERYFVKAAHNHKKHRNFTEAFHCMEVAHLIIEREREFSECPTVYEETSAEIILFELLPFLEGIIGEQTTPAEILEGARDLHSSVVQLGILKDVLGIIEWARNGPKGAYCASTEDFIKSTK